MKTRSNQLFVQTIAVLGTEMIRIYASQIYPLMRLPVPMIRWDHDAGGSVQRS